MVYCGLDYVGSNDIIQEKEDVEFLKGEGIWNSKLIGGTPHSKVCGLGEYIWNLCAYVLCMQFF